jgi:CheY-like chemotaxis protein
MDETADLRQIRRPNLPDGPRRYRRGERVLVVDDEADVLFPTVELFRIMGYETFGAASAAEALAQLDVSRDFQVLFTDVLMPGMDGVALAREARRLVPGIKVVLVSAYPESAMDPDLRLPGEDFHFLLKPFLLSEVAIVLRR